MGKRKVFIGDQKRQWAFTDWLDDAISDIVEEIAKDLSDEEHPIPDDVMDEIYELADIGEARDALIGIAENVMNAELVFDEEG